MKYIYTGADPGAVFSGPVLFSKKKSDFKAISF